MSTELIHTDEEKCMSFKLFTKFPYRDIHTAGYGKDKNCVKQSDEVFLVGEGGGEKAVEDEAAQVGDDHGYQAGNPCHCTHVTYLIPSFVSYSDFDPWLIFVALIRVWFFSCYTQA